MRDVNVTATVLLPPCLAPASLSWQQISGDFRIVRTFSFSLSPRWGICSVLKWSLNTGPQCTVRHDTRDRREKKHAIHHESLRPGRQQRHQAGHLSPCRCFYLPCFVFPDSARPSISQTDPAFLAVSMRFIFSPFIHHSLTLSFQSGLNRIFLSSTSPSHTSPIWLPFCPWRSLHTSNTAFCVCVSVSSHLLYTEYQSPHSSWKEGHGYFKGQFEG